MGKPAVEHEMRNVPPVRVFTWRKEGSALPRDGKSYDLDAHQDLG